jgi:hypothetical protein
MIGKLVAEVATRGFVPNRAICVPRMHGPAVGRLFSACHAVA